MHMYCTCNAVVGVLRSGGLLVRSGYRVCVCVCVCVCVQCEMMSHTNCLCSCLVVVVQCQQRGWREEGGERREEEGGGGRGEHRRVGRE